MRARIGLGALALAGGGLVGGGLAGCGAVGEGRRLELGPAEIVSQATTNGATPMVLVTARGDRVVAWVSAPDGGADGILHFSVTPHGAAEPLPTVSLRDPLGSIEAHGEAPPKLASGPDGSIAVLYAVGKEVPGRRFPLSALRFVRSEDLGRTWSAPVSVTGSEELGAYNFHALTTGPGGELLATWLEARQGKSGVWMSRSDDGGRRWSAPRPISTDPACPCCRTAVAVGRDGATFVAWRHILASDVRDVVVARSADGGATWGEPVRPRAHDWVFPGCPHAGPAMQLDSAGVLHLAWWTGKAGEAGVYYARSTDGGRTFVDVQPMAAGARSTPAHVQLAAAADGTVVVAWDDGLSPLPRILVRVSRDGGRRFGPTEVLSDEGVAASYPVVALFGDSLAVAWSQRSDSAHRAELAARPDMKDPKAVMRLPRVGQSEIFLRLGRL
ncbi:MAG TPA: sialidase family protein [Gemmatimonadales bacterium]|nr:sialidase family protein [Gemmatimonadales bacterium]